MNFILKKVKTLEAYYTANEDGTVTATNVEIIVAIEGAPEGKFLQREVIPSAGTDAFPIVFPATLTMAEANAFVNQKAQDYVTATYPNT